MIGIHDREIQIAQLQNETWSNLIDGIQVWCGSLFANDSLQFNQDTNWQDNCQPLFQAARDAGVQFQLMISGDVPVSAYDNAQPWIDDAIAIQKHLGIDGFSLDDERDCAPLATLSELHLWLNFHNSFTTALSEHGIPVTSAIQAVFAIQDNADNHPCDHSPATYPFEPRVSSALAQAQAATLQKWLIMDTYYFLTGQFMGALDWHVKHIPLQILAIGMSNRADLTKADLVARFHAIDKSGVDWINIFMMPIADNFLPFLSRWKTHCAGCGAQSILGCYDLTIECHAPPNENSSTVL
mgnify:CR=1 FL=1